MAMGEVREAGPAKRVKTAVGPFSASRGVFGLASLSLETSDLGSSGLAADEAQVNAAGRAVEEAAAGDMCAMVDARTVVHSVIDLKEVV